MIYDNNRVISIIIVTTHYTYYYNHSDILYWLGLGADLPLPLLIFTKAYTYSL